MCLIILINRESVDRYWELKREGSERRRKFLQKFLPCLRPAVSEDQHGASQQMDHHIEDGKPPGYASETSLLLAKEAPK
jgi:hypothetical protein